MASRIESRLARAERRKQTGTDRLAIVVVEDENFFGTANLLARIAGVADGQAVEKDEGATSEPGGEDDDETA